MKKLSKVLAMLLAVALCLCMAPAAFAANGTGSITVKNTTPEATYKAYKIFDATQAKGKDAERNEIDIISYLATEDQVTGYNNFGNDNPFTFTGPNSDKMYTVAVKTDRDGKALFTDEQVIDFLAAHIAASDLPGVVYQKDKDQTGTGGEVTFSELPFGYYYITSTVGTVVTIDSTNPNATVIDKNQQPKFDKTMSPDERETPEGGEKTGAPANDGDYGDVIDYTLETDATNYIGKEQVKSYYFLDKLDPGLAFTADEVVVSVNGAKLDPSKYTFQWLHSTSDVDEKGNAVYNNNVAGYDAADSFSVFIPWVDTANNSLYDADVKITITYKGVIVDNAAVVDPHHNTAQYWVGKDTQPPETPEPSEDWGYDHDEKVTVTYTYALALLKVDKNGNKLANAEFELTDPEGNKIYAKDNGDGTYNYAGVLAGDVTKVPDDCTSTFVTDSQGKFVLKGVDHGTYTAKETKAPDGFNLVDDDFTIEAKTLVGKSENSTSYDRKWYVEYDENGNIIKTENSYTYKEAKNVTEFDVNVAAAAFSVVNYQGTVLPATGGIGTTIFYVAGGALVLVALVLLITKKRMGNKE